jgi:hypothetical protein
MYVLTVVGHAYTDTQVSVSFLPTRDLASVFSWRYLANSR